MRIRAGLRMVPDCAILFKSKLLGLLLISHLLQLGDLEVPWDSLVSISRLWISMSLFLTAYSMWNFSPNTEQLWSYSCFTRAARSSLLMPDTSGSSPTFSLTTSGTTMVRGVCEEWATGCAAVHSPMYSAL